MKTLVACRSYFRGMLYRHNSSLGVELSLTASVYKYISNTIVGWSCLCLDASYPIVMLADLCGRVCLSVRDLML